MTYQVKQESFDRLSKRRIHDAPRPLPPYAIAAARAPAARRMPPASRSALRAARRAAHATGGGVVAFLPFCRRAALPVTLLPVASHVAAVVL